MGDVSAAIQGFIVNEIALSREDVSSAVTTREWFLNRVENEIMRRSNEPMLYTPDPLVRFGSYFKRTKVKDVDEFDILVALDACGGFYTDHGIQIGTGLGSAFPNPIFNGNFHKGDGSGVSSIRLLLWLKDVVDTVVRAFGGDAPIRDGEAITAHIKSKNLKIDLVPAPVLRRNDGRTFYCIPRGDVSGGWRSTAPQEDIALLYAVAKGKPWFRDVIRLCKHIRTAYNFKVSSFAIESAIVEYGQANHWFTYSLKDNFYGALNHLASAFAIGYITDPFDYTSNLVEGVGSLAWYGERLGQLVTSLRALESEYDETKVRVKVAQLLMNQ